MAESNLGPAFGLLAGAVLPILVAGPIREADRSAVGEGPDLDWRIQGESLIHNRSMSDLAIWRSSRRKIAKVKGLSRYYRISDDIRDAALTVHPLQTAGASASIRLI